jgi:hypothetical protein
MKELFSQISQTACLCLVSCQWLLWSADLGCVSLRTCGYRTRKLLLGLGGTRQVALHRNGFAGIHPDAAGWFSEWRGALGVVLGTSQYIVRPHSKQSCITNHSLPRQQMLTLTRFNHCQK